MNDKQKAFSFVFSGTSGVFTGLFQCVTTLVVYGNVRCRW